MHFVWSDGGFYTGLLVDLYQMSFCKLSSGWQRGGCCYLYWKLVNKRKGFGGYRIFVGYNPACWGCWSGVLIIFILFILYFICRYW